MMCHFAVNRPAGVVRGQSDLAPLLPWLRRYRDWLLDRVRLNKYRSAYLWHVVLTGADRRAVIQRQNELAEPPNPGSIIVSNEKEEWTAVQPDIKADDVQADGLAMRLMIAAGAGVPLYWLAEAEHTARGTAGEMSEPTYRHFRQRQLYFGWAMRRLAVRALHRRGLTQVGIGDVRAEFPELDAANQLPVAQSVFQLTNGLQLAQQAGWVDDDEAAQIFRHFVGELSSYPQGEDLGAARGAPGFSQKQKGSHRGRKPPKVLDPSDPRAREPIPPPLVDGGLSGFGVEPVVRI